MRRPVLWILIALVFLVIAVQDLTAASVVLVGALAVVLMVRYRGSQTMRVALVTVTIGITMIGVIAALAVPRYRAAADPLLVASQPSQQTGAHPKGDFELSAFVVADNDNATNSVDQQASDLTTVTSTGGLVNTDGSFLYQGVANALIHAHLAGARGELLIQNYDPAAAAGAGSFSPALGHAVLSSPAAMNRFAEQVAQVVTREHWDGVSIDFEQLTPGDQVLFPRLLGAIKRQLPLGKRLRVNVPTPSGTDPWPMNMASVAAYADVVNIMTYDEHDPTGTPGPIASLPWVRSSIAAALRWVPAKKLQIGVPDYGYAWGPAVKSLGTSFTVTQAVRYVTAHGARPRWDATAGEWTAHLADGSTLWWSDARSMRAMVHEAVAADLEGAAIWELSIAPSLTTVRAQVPLYRGTVVTYDLTRLVNRVRARGLVALTFDDGPDPTWTPQVLSVLATKHVPATFFDIGMAAEAHPEIVQREVSQGNVVGDHTYSHLDLTQIPLWRAKLEIAAGQWVLHGITGRTPVLFRSPYGNAEMADSNSAQRQDLATQLGMQPVSWNVDPEDWQRPGVAQIVARATSTSSDNLIILLHDGGGNRAQTVAALPQIIDKLRAEGYVFVTADQLDGSVSSAYAPSPTTFWGVVSALLMIASFRLWVSAHTVIVWALLCLGVLSLFRVLISWPLAFVHRRRQRQTHSERGYAPLTLDHWTHTVTLLIPAHNEQATLAKTLLSLKHVRGPLVQVLVAENGSTDATIEVARNAAVTMPELPIEVLELGSIGKANALNACLGQSRGDIIVVLDADTIINADFIERIIPHFDNSDVGAVAGNVKVGNRNRLLPRLQSLEYVMSLAVDRRAQAMLNVVSVVPGAAGAFRKDALVRVGGWPARTLTEDTDLTVALLSAGWQVPYEATAISWTEAPETVSDVMKQRRRWSYGAAQVSAVHGRRMLDVREGRTGLLALPWIMLAQVILPAAAPLVDLFLLWLVLNGDWKIAGGMLALALIADLALAAWALRTDGESLRQLWLVPVSRFVWRPLMLVAVAGSLNAWLLGRSVAWRKIQRRNTVLVDSTNI